MNIQSDLFSVEVKSNCSVGWALTAVSYRELQKTLERETRQCQALVIWTDCDREGENIGFEVIHVCKAGK